jgi:hypothetical protein
MASKVASFAAKRLMKDEFKKYADKNPSGDYVSYAFFSLQPTWLVSYGV